MEETRDVYELRLPLKEALDMGDRTHRQLLALLLAMDHVMALLASTLHWFAEGEKHEVPVKDMFIARYHVHLVLAMGCLHEALSKFDDVDKRDWFDSNLPTEGEHRAKAITALEGLRSIRAGAAPLGDVRNWLASHFDSSRLASVYQGFLSSGHEPALLRFCGPIRGESYSPLAGELAINAIAGPSQDSQGDLFHTYELATTIQGHLLDLCELCFVTFWERRGARLSKVN